MLISNIPTDTFNRIVADLCSDGWEKVAEYDGFDAWIDYGMIVLKKHNVRLKFEWDNWFEGTMEGSEALLQKTREKYTL